MSEQQDHITAIDAPSFAARTAHVAAAELYGLMTSEDGAPNQDWLASRGNLEGELEALAKALIEDDVTNPETMWLHGVGAGLVRREARDYRELPFARRMAWQTFTRLCGDTWRTIVSVQDAIRAEAVANAAVFAPLAKEDSILEEHEPLDTPIEGVKEYQAQQARIREQQGATFNGADPAAFDHDGDGKPGGSKPLSIGETPAQPPVNRGGRGKAKTARDRASK